MAKTNYTYEILIKDITLLAKTYPFLEISAIGSSSLGNALHCIRFGKGKKEVFYSASFHANEWITSSLLMKFMKELCLAYISNSTIYGYNAASLFSSVSLYIVPMVNPDGVNIVTGGYLPEHAYSNVVQISKNFPNIPFPNGWKANINGTDLNLQFPAKWEKAKEIKYAQGFNNPSPRDFVGFGPLTEPESLAIYNFTLLHNFSLILAYHTQGKEIYWQFLDYAPAKSLPIANKFSKSSGYTVADAPYESSFAGYKDWFLQEYKKPGYTIEAGLGISPLPISQFDEIYKDNIGILVLGMVL